MAPQLAAIVQIAADLYAALFGRLTGCTAQLHQIFPQRRGDARKVEPIGPLKNPIPVKILGSGFLNGAVRTVVNTHRAALCCAFFVEVNAHAAAPAGDQAGIHAKAAQIVYHALANGVGGQLGDECGIQPKVCQRHRHIGFAPAKGEFQIARLHKALVMIRLQADHDLAKGNNSHNGILLIFLPGAPQSLRSRRSYK